MYEEGRFTTRGRELLNAIECLVFEKCVELVPGCKKKDAEVLGKGVADTLALEWGGQSVYVPMDNARRNAAIYEEFDGQNHHKLAEKFHMSTNQVYKIIADERKRRRQKQGSLFGFDKCG